ncbi:prepilin-type N-terminal cleavage/methylation domain-containing protein [Sulfuriroseicoccus oceanibius]|uniref:Prepilin-type N-terminal cleavage/methylation domain-containing protein n=1 Tax=Sulfuriroseicoccus oceanibius TaxID=2707525 RepID=A0A6B3L7G0_9BACT|nr:prepilin-type N-terminal cleavage/methylation domain-containing protein [Sulfuriroseicoccus oceanibius]QQL45707.1 prepilin-type N-terminal cleavage/methylation domain-containing protein [Sulfuriroseicoccus oceanibius]
MKPRHSQLSNRASRSRGFTLIELLIVIAIVAILASMIFAGSSFALKKARKVEAQNLATGIAQAVEQFEVEYNRMPIPGSSRGQDWEGDSSEEICVILTGQETGGKVLNKKQIDYLDGMKQANDAAGGIDRTEEDRPVVFDPWGNFFVIHIDGNYDKKLRNPESSEDGEDELKGVRVAVLSKGEDGIAAGENEEGDDATQDNARSW